MVNFLTEDQSNIKMPIKTAITKKTSIKPPIGGLIIDDIKNKILGKKYDLSLVFVNDNLSQELNSKYRKKNSPTNVLSFPLDKYEGEILMNIKKIKEESKNYKISLKSYFTFLLIHSLLHLKGMDHSKKMSQKETYWLKKLEIPITPNIQKFLV